MLHEIGDHIGVMPGRSAFDSRRKIQNKVVFGGFAPRLLDGGAEIDAEINIAVGELLRRELVCENFLHAGLFDEMLDQSGSFHRHFFEFFPGLVEDDPAMQIGGCQIRMKSRRPTR